MRIALSNPDVNLSGGVERVIVATANCLADRGHEVTVYAARVDMSVLDARVRVRQIPVPARLDAVTGLGFRRRCARALAADRPDIHGAFSSLSPRGGLFWVPSVHRVGYELLLARRTFAQGLRVRFNPYHRVRLWLERSMLSAGGCRLALAQTETVRQEILGWYGEATPTDVLALGYDERAFDPALRAQRRSEARRTFGYGDGDRVVLFAANELERKGFDVLLRAAGQIPDVHILGAGRETPSPQLTARSGLGDRLRWVGHVADIGLLHAAADVLVLPSRYEPWGLVIVEALGSGLPVIVSGLAGAAVAVRDRRTGWLLADPEDVRSLAEALRWALSGSAASAEEIAHSVRNYSWPRVIERYEVHLSAVAGRP